MVMIDAMEPLSCAYPLPSPNQAHISVREWELLASTDPIEVKRELLYCYARLHPSLIILILPARYITRDLSDDTIVKDDIFIEELHYQLVHFVDQLLTTVYLVRFTCYLYKQLPDNTLDSVAIQDQWCALDLLFHQLGALHQVAQEHED
jgi:hypothetical protein